MVIYHQHSINFLCFFIIKKPQFGQKWFLSIHLSVTNGIHAQQGLTKKQIRPAQIYVTFPT